MCKSTNKENLKILIIKSIEIFRMIVKNYNSDNLQELNNNQIETYIFELE